jgi:hypothetical protein
MATRTSVQYMENSKEPDPKKISGILMAEVDRTARQAAKVLVKDVSAGSQDTNEPQMIEAVKANWGNPQFRSDLLQAQSPERVINWVLKAFHPGVSVAQYTKMLEADPKAVPGFETGPNTGAPPQPKVEPPPQLAPATGAMQPPMPPPPMQPPMGAPILPPGGPI